MVDYSAWLGQENPRVMLVEAQVRSGGETVTRYLADQTWVSAPTDTPANTVFEGRIIRGTEIERTMGSVFAGQGGASNGGELVIVNPDGELDSWIDDDWHGQQLIIRFGNPTWAYADIAVRLTGVSEELIETETTLRLILRDRSLKLREPAQQVVQYGGPEIGATQPLSFGFPKNITPLMWDDEPSVAPTYVVHEANVDVEDVAVTRYAAQEPSTSPTIVKTNDEAKIKYNGDPGGLVTLDTKGALNASAVWIETPGESLEYLLTRTIDELIGIAKGSGGGLDTLQLNDHAPSTDDVLNGLSMTKGRFEERGDDAYESKTVSDYDGATRTVTADSNWTNVGKEGDGYRIGSVSPVLQIGPLVASQVDSAAFTQLDTDWGNPQIGLYISKGESYIDVLEQTLGPGAFWAWNTSGQLTVGLLKDPSAEAIDLELDEGDQPKDGKFETQPVGAPIFRLSFGYDKNYSPESGRVAGVDPLRGAFVQREYRWHKREDYSILDNNPEALELFVPSLWTTEAEALIERDRLWDLFSVQRFFYRITAFTKPFELELGQIVNLTDTRFLPNGKKTVLIQIVERPLDERSELLLWG